VFFTRHRERQRGDVIGDESLYIVEIATSLARLLLAKTVVAGHLTMILEAASRMFLHPSPLSNRGKRRGIMG